MQRAHRVDLPGVQRGVLAAGTRRNIIPDTARFEATVRSFSEVLTTEQMAAYGWRVPFVLGGVFGLYALVMRLRMRESETFEQEASASATGGPSVWRRMLAHPRALARVVLLTSGLTVVYYVWSVVYYVWSVAAPAYAISARGVDPAAALWAGAAALVVFMLVLPFWGAPSDRFGRRPTQLVPLAILAVLLYPLDATIHDGWTLFAAMTVALILIGAGCAVGPALFAELFPTGIRAAGLGVPYSLAVAPFGGTAPYLQSLFARIGHPGWFLAYAIALMLVTGTALWLLPETAGRDLGTVDEEVPAARS